MTPIHFEFDYPVQVSKKEARIIRVGCSIRLIDRLTLKSKDSGVWLVPIQRPLRWAVETWSGIDDKIKAKVDLADLERLLRGRHWGRIELLLYSAFLDSRKVIPNPYEPRIAAELGGMA